MANITLKIDDELLEKARKLALQKNTSINAIIKQKLKDFVVHHLEREVTLRGLEEFYGQSKAVIGDKTWTRAELHER